MGKKLLDLSHTEIVNAIEENLFAWIPLFGKLGEVHLDDPPGTRRSITDIPLSLFNSVMDARLAPEKVDDAIHSILTEAQSRQVPVLWWKGPSTQPPDLDKDLKKHGFIIDDEDTPCMVVDLSNLNVIHSVAEDVSIQLVDDDASRNQWSNTLGLGFETPVSMDMSMNTWSKLLGEADPAIIFPYLALWNDKPVATSILFLAAGVAGIYCVATVPEARRKGIGTWITLHCLRQACEMGYQIGVLQASEMGFGVYRSLGFVEYCQMSTYRWKPKNCE